MSAPNQGALERFTFGGDLLCVPPASKDAESSSNQVLFCSVLPGLGHIFSLDRHMINFPIFLSLGLDIIRTPGAGLSRVFWPKS